MEAQFSFVTGDREIAGMAAEDLERTRQEVLREVEQEVKRKGALELNREELRRTITKAQWMQERGCSLETFDELQSVIERAQWALELAGR